MREKCGSDDGSWHALLHWCKCAALLPLRQHRLHELRAYLASTEAPLRSPDDQEAYRPTEPEYYGSDGVQHSVRRIYEDAAPKRDKMVTDIFGD